MLTSGVVCKFHLDNAINPDTESVGQFTIIGGEHSQ